MTQWLRIADTRLPLRGQRRVWFWSANRTGFPFHSPQLSVNTKNSGKAPDNFGNDANCRPGEWQAANIEVLQGRGRPRRLAPLRARRPAACLEYCAAAREELE
jgi:hypothetical protein